MMAKNDALSTLTASVGVSLKENNFTITVTLAGPFSSWLAEEEGAPSDDEIVKWAAKSLEESE
jgi:hypothetical protein